MPGFPYLVGSRSFTLLITQLPENHFPDGIQFVIHHIPVNNAVFGNEALVPEEFHSIVLFLPDIKIKVGFRRYMFGKVFDKGCSDSPAPSVGTGNQFVNQKLGSVSGYIGEDVTQDFTV